MGMNILKYIITESKIPLLFSSNMPHNEVLTKAISAGFVVVNYDVTLYQFHVKCFGESSSLGVRSQKEDELVIEKFLNTYFFSFAGDNWMDKSEGIL